MFYKTSRPRFYTELHHYPGRLVDAGRHGHRLWGEKAVFFTDARNNVLKGTARYIVNVMHRT